MAEQRPIVTGVRQQGYVEVVDGLRPGERIVADGMNKVQPGQAVRVSPRPSVIAVGGGSGGRDDYAARAGGAAPGAAVRSSGPRPPGARPSDSSGGRPAAPRTAP
jgi:membrane fusion protein (multidrug efflux system)